jgi:general secretion pathway protein J
MIRGPAQAGFTLLELLVAMTVLGVLTGLLASGLSFGTRIWERERGQLDVATELQLVQDVLRRLLTQALPLSTPPERGRTAEPEPTFVGSEDSVEFLGPPPAQVLAGGVYAYRVVARTEADGVRLVLEWRLRPPQAGTTRVRVTNAELEEQDQLATQHEVVLLKALNSAEFSFFGAGEEQGSSPTWRNNWRSSTKSPQLVRLKIGFRPGDPRIWPDLLVAPRIALESSE